jgi:TldD protein
VTSDPQDAEDPVRNAIAEAARALPASDPRAHVFFEDRADVRMTLASSGLRDVVVTRTRGAAISGRRSVHVTDPEFMGALEGPRPFRSAHENWVAGLETVIVAAGTAASAGRRRPHWSAKLVSFHQQIWVGTQAGEVSQDTRRGCRVELRVQVGGEGAAHAAEELVLRPEGPSRLPEGFTRAFDRAEARLSRVSATPTGPTSAVFAPGVAGVVVHELIGHALEGDVVVRGPTWIRAAGFPAAGRPVTVADDPLRGRGAWTIDDEGVAARETTLIDRGRPSGALLDRASAKALGTVSTGHGRRSSYLEPVRPRMGCTFIEPGNDDSEEVLRSTRTGVFIRRLAAGHTDPFSGRGTFIVSDADRIVDGHLAEPLDVFVLELDGVESWRSIDRVAHDLMFDTCIGSCVRDGQPLAVSVGGPTIRIGVVTVRS